MQNTAVTGTLGCSVSISCDEQIEFVLMYSYEVTIQSIPVIWKVLMVSLLIGNKIHIIIQRHIARVCSKDAEVSI